MSPKSSEISCLLGPPHAGSGQPQHVQKDIDAWGRWDNMKHPSSHDEEEEKDEEDDDDDDDGDDG